MTRFASCQLLLNNNRYNNLVRYYYVDIGGKFMFHTRLASLRDKTGLSQVELAKRLGIARTTYSGYENGSREPDLTMLNKLASFFDVNVHWLVTGAEKPMSEGEQKIVDAFQLLSEADKDMVLELMERLKKERH